MSGSFLKTVVVIDSMAFRRARVESFLTSWALEESVGLVSVPPPDAHTRLVEEIDCCMLIYNIGGTPSFAHENLAEMRVLRTLRPSAALVIVSDDESLESIIAAIHGGARGYFGNSIPPGLALQALSFILRGGSYFPPEAILLRHAHMPGCAHQNGSGDASQIQAPAQPNQISMTASGSGFRQQQSSFVGEPPESDAGRLPDYGSFDGSAAPFIAANPSAIRHSVKLQLSERQQAVFECLCRGDPNKVIGRSLGMTEATVKVHVREIMRKLGVVNRTQVAIAAAQVGFSSGTIVRMTTADSSIGPSSFRQQH